MKEILKEEEFDATWDFYVFDKDIVSIDHLKAKSAILLAFTRHAQWLEQEHAETHPALKPSEAITIGQIAASAKLPVGYVDVAVNYLIGEGHVIESRIHPHEGPSIKAFRLKPLDD